MDLMFFICWFYVFSPATMPGLICLKRLKELTINEVFLIFKEDMRALRRYFGFLPDFPFQTIVEMFVSLWRKSTH
ncbi:MAG: hypothetical protein JWQ54_463 [Mucilaginibacter sp.]|nr:hypothetical protein [Mucilaginibacter sp.]